jgi:predicted dehydrogenase
MKKNAVSRRKFVAASALTLGGLITMNLPSIGYGKQRKVVRIGLIGSGSRGQGLIALMKGLPDIELVACCDIIPERLEQGLKASKGTAKPYTDYRKILDDKSIDAVLIATPLYTHYAIAVDALNAGKHIYLEKTMTYDIPQALDLVKKVREAKTIFQVGFQYRSFALYHKVKEVIAQNWLGKITHFETQYNRNSNWRFPVSDPTLERAINWRMYREYSGGLLAELCSHQLDAINYLMELQPVRVTGMGGINYWKDGRETYDNVRMVYEYQDGIKASVTSILSNAYNGFCIRILGDKATLQIQSDKITVSAESTKNAQGIVDGVSGATLKSITQGEAVEIPYKAQGEKLPEPTTVALQEFFESIRTGKKPTSNVETAKIAAIAVHMGNKAAETQTYQEWKPEYSI